jgi:hypothetical protein
MFNIALSRHEYLVVVCTGSPVLNDYLAAVGLIADVVAREGTRSVLIDLASIPYGLSDEDRLALARSAAERLAGVRLAVVAYTPTRLQQPESVAQRTGLQVRVFGDISEARSWLVHGVAL